MVSRGETGNPDAMDGPDYDRGFRLALAVTIALVFGGAVLVFGLLVGPVLTVLLCSVLVICVAGLAVAML